jgi:hypothetical protein
MTTTITTQTQPPRLPPLNTRGCRSIVGSEACTFETTGRYRLAPPNFSNKYTKLMRCTRAISGRVVTSEVAGLIPAGAELGPSYSSLVPRVVIAVTRARIPLGLPLDAMHRERKPAVHNAESVWSTTSRRRKAMAIYTGHIAAQYAELQPQSRAFKSFPVCHFPLSSRGPGYALVRGETRIRLPLAGFFCVLA